MAHISFNCPICGLDLHGLNLRINQEGIAEKIPCLAPSGEEECNEAKERVRKYLTLYRKKYEK